MALKRLRSSSKRSAKRSRQSKQVPTVVGALAHAACLPANLRSLLKVTLPVVLSANKVDRHPYEVEVVHQGEQALSTVQAALQQEHKDSLAKQNATIAPAENAKRVKAKQDAEAHSEAVKAKLEANKASKKACEKSVHDAEEAVKVAVKEEKAADKELQRFVDKKATLTNSLSAEFVMLKEGTSNDATGKKAVQKLLSLGKEFGLDSTLLHTFPMTCKKQPEHRSEFETMTFTSLHALIDSQIQGLSQHVAGAEPVKAAKDAAVAAARESLANAQNQLKAADDELNATHTATAEAKKDVSKADAHLRHIWEDMRKACDAQDGLAADLKNFRENIWVAFNQLKEKEPEPEPVEEPAAMEEAAPEETAPAETVPAQL